MDGLAQFWAASDGVARAVVALLLGMSISAWVLIFWKGWVLQRARRDIERAVNVDRRPGEFRHHDRGRSGFRSRQGRDGSQCA